MSGSEWNRGRYLLRLTVVAALYALCAKLGLLFPLEEQSVTLVWPASGIGLAAVLVYGYRMWPGIVLGIILSIVITHAPPLYGIGVTVSSTLEALAGAYLLHWFQFDKRLGSVRDILLFVFVGIGVSSLFGTALEIASAVLAGITLSQPVASVWSLWWLGDSMGALVTAPFFLAWLAPSSPLHLTSTRILEAVVLIGILLGVSLIVFAEPALSHAARYPLAYLLSPLLLLAAFHFEMRGATTAILAVVVLAVWGAFLGTGPFAGTTPYRGIALLWAFMSVMSVTTLVLTAMITERRRMDNERIQLQRQLHQSQKMDAIGQLTGGIAHDFNNMLTSILGFSELAQDRLKSIREDKLNAYLAEIRQAARRAKELVQQLLTFSRASEASLVTFDGAALIHETLNMLRATMPATVEIRSDVEARTLTVSMDPIMLQQMVMNLCLNARDAMKDNGRIDITARRRYVSNALCASCHKVFSGEFVELSVKDNGPGIAAEVRERLFEPFFTTKPVGEGTGLGLSVVHGIMHSSGGHITVSDALGRGGAFHLFFPPAESVPPQGDTPEDAAREIQPGEGRVLVVDDEVSVASYLRVLLEGSGFKVTTQTDPVAALKVFKADIGAIDVVVTDQTMPRLTGLEMAKQMHSLRPDLPIIICSGYHERFTEEQLALKGIHGFCPKPIERAGLLKSIRQATHPHISA